MNNEIIKNDNEINNIFDNIFRITIFILPSILSYKYNDIRISIGFHCTCNLFSTISFINAVI